MVSAITYARSPTIKGPGYRITNDVRRLWTCPNCGRSRKLPGSVVSQRCECSTPGAWMTLTAEPSRRGFVVPRLIEPAELPKEVEPPAEAVTEVLAKVPPAAAIPAPEAAVPPTEALRVDVEPPISPPAPPGEPPAATTQPAATAPPPRSATPSGAPSKSTETVAPESAGQPPQKARRKRNRGRRRKGKPGGAAESP